MPLRLLFRLDSLARVATKAKEAWGLPRVDIYLQDTDLGKQWLRHFRKRHPKYKIIGNKTIGVALIRLPEDIALYLRGKSRQVVRTNLTKAKKAGYSFSNFAAGKYIDAILKINCSTYDRQGRSIPASYTDRAMVEGFCRENESLCGVFTRDHQLVAYAQPVKCGELALVNRLLGHNDHLPNGVMYILMVGVIEHCINEHAVRWLMYDTMFGASPGLRYFKERLGFEPYRVKWRLAR